MLTKHLLPTALVCAFLLLISSALAFEVVVDIGHDPRQSGTFGASGATEYEWNRIFARELATALASAGYGVTVFEAPPDLSLPTRVKNLDALGGDLLISVHHDSVQERHLSETTAFGKSTRYTDAASGYSLFVSAEDPSYITALDVGTAIGNALRRRGIKRNLYHALDIEGERRPLIDASIALYRFDDLQVLRDVPVPGVLIEVGVIRNPLDEARAGDSSFRARFINAVVEGISMAAEHLKSHLPASSQK